MHVKEIQQLIEAGLTQCTAQVEGDDGVHFSATVISPDFAGKNRLQQQRLVYATLGDRIHDGTIHALSLKTLTPEEWQHSI